MNLDFPNCPLCQAQDHRLEYDFQPFEVVKCQSCRFRYLRPRPPEEEILELYSDDGYFHNTTSPGYEDYLSQERALRLTFRGLLRQMSRCRATGGPLLELGCGPGYFLSEAAGYFDALYATDFSRGALGEVSPDLAQTYLGGLESVPAEKTFRCIVMSHVLEHIYDPIGHLRGVRERLQPGGSAVVVVPNYDSPIRWLLQKRWPSFKIPEHVMYFQESSLKRTFERAGFEQTTTLRYPHAFPLSLLFGKFGIRLPDWLGEKVVWIPTTCIAMLGTRTA